MTVTHTNQALELIKYANEIGYGSLPYIALDMATKIRKVFAEVITDDINRPYNEQVQRLTKACEVTGIEFVNADVFGDMDDVGILRLTREFNNPTTNETGEIMVDVFVGLELHDEQADDTEENTFLVCPHYADVVLNINEQQAEIVFQDVITNELAIELKGDDVSLQVNTHELDANGRTFVYDGCHKLYVITSDADREDAKKYDYIVDFSKEDNEKEHPIRELEEYYLKSCPLRFIHYFDLRSDDILPQGTDCPMFIYF